MNERHDLIIQLAENNHGIVTRDLAAELGFDKHAWARLRASKEWDPLSDLVLRRRGSAPTQEQRLLAAVFDAGPGAVLGGESAAAHWGIPGFSTRPGAPIHVVRAEGLTRRRSQLAVVHTTVRLTGDHVRTLDGIPTSSPVQTMFDLARTCSAKRLARAVDNAWSMRLLSGAELHDQIEAVAMSGRDGIGAMREVLAKRDRDYIPPASGLEARFMEITEVAGEETMERQVDVGDGERWVGRIDFKKIALPIIIEVNSERYHTALCDREADELRYERLRAAGFEVVVVWDYEVFHTPWVVRARIREAERRVRERIALAA